MGKVIEQLEVTNGNADKMFEEIEQAYQYAQQDRITTLFMVDEKDILGDLLENHFNMHRENRCYYSFNLKDGTTAEPYYPFLSFIKKEVEGDLEKIAEMLQSISMYKPHQDILKSWFVNSPIERKEPIVYRDFIFEKRIMRENIIRLLSRLDEENTRILHLKHYEYANQGTRDILQLLQEEVWVGKLFILVTGSQLTEDKSQSLSLEDWDPSQLKQEMEWAQNQLHLLAWEDCREHLKEIDQNKRLLPFDIQTSVEEQLVKLIGDSHYLLSEFQEAIDYYHILAKQIDTDKDPLLLARTYVRMAHAQLHNGNRDLATYYAKEGIKLATALECEEILFEAHHIYYYYAEKGHLFDVEQWKAVYGQLVALAIKLDYKNHLAYLYGSPFYYFFCHTEKELSKLYEGMRVAKDMGNLACLARCYHALAMFYSGNGYYDKCVENLLKASQYSRKYAKKLTLIELINGTGYFYFLMGKYTDALKQHEEALELLEGLDEPKELVMTYYNIGLILVNLGRYAEAAKIYEGLIHYEKAHTLGDMFFLPQFSLYTLAAIANLGCNQLENATYFYGIIQESVDEVENKHPLERFYFHILTALMYQKEGKSSDALKAFMIGENDLLLNENETRFILPWFYYEYIKFIAVYGGEQLHMEMVMKGYEISERVKNDHYREFFLNQVSNVAQVDYNEAVFLNNINYDRVVKDLMG